MFSENPTSIPHVGDSYGLCICPQSLWWPTHGNDWYPLGLCTDSKETCFSVHFLKKAIMTWIYTWRSLTNKRPFHAGGNSNLWEEVNVWQLYREALFSAPCKCILYCQLQCFFKNYYREDKRVFPKHLISHNSLAKFFILLTGHKLWQRTLM